MIVLRHYDKAAGQVLGGSPGPLPGLLGHAYFGIVLVAYPA